MYLIEQTVLKKSIPLIKYFYIRQVTCMCTCTHISVDVKNEKFWFKKFLIKLLYILYSENQLFMDCCIFNKVQIITTHLKCITTLIIFTNATSLCVLWLMCGSVFIIYHCCSCPHYHICHLIVIICLYLVA
jgi:hypothetical protein